MTRTDRLALILAVAAVLVTAFISIRVFDRLPHIEDEFAYIWEAQAISHGQMSVSAPVCSSCFLVPFVVDYHGIRSGKYPLGWPVVLSAGILLGARWLVNPLLAGLGLWLLYRLVKKVLDEKTALLAAGLTLTSPFFLMNSSTLLSHAWTLVLTLAFAISWLDTFDPANKIPKWITISTAGLSLGVFALTRPLSAIGIALPFIVHGLFLLWRGPAAHRRFAIEIGVIAGLVASLHFLWQFAVTGNALMNPYQIWWQYDAIGFGPSVGLQAGGYKPIDAYANAVFSLNVGIQDIWGWIEVSWIFLPIGLWAVRRNARAWVVAGLLPAVVLAYTLYWIGSWLFGPRYYYEALPAAALLTAAGIRWLAGSDLGRWKADLAGHPRFRRLGMTFIIGLLISLNLLFYLPVRLASLQGLNGQTRDHLEPFYTKEAQALAPALVIVHTEKSWYEYGVFLELSDPFLNTPFIFIKSISTQVDQAVSTWYPDRQILSYFPKSQPWQFYKGFIVPPTP